MINWQIAQLRKKRFAQVNSDIHIYTLYPQNSHTYSKLKVLNSHCYNKALYKILISTDSLITKSKINVLYTSNYNYCPFNESGLVLISLSLSEVLNLLLSSRLFISNSLLILLEIGNEIFC